MMYVVEVLHWQVFHAVQISASAAASEGVPWRYVLIPIGAVVAAILAPVFTNWFQSRREKFHEQQQRKKVVSLLKAEFGHIARHSATNLKRVTELYRETQLAAELKVALLKISLKQPEIIATEALFSAVKIEDLALLPEYLTRDALRIQLTARNIEIDVDAALQQLEVSGSSDIDLTNVGPLQSLFRKLVNTVQRCARDSSEMVEKLRRYEEDNYKIAKQGRTDAIFGGGHRFADKPMHFDDAASLREPGDWKSWSEEQKLFSFDDISRLLIRKLKLDVGVEDVRVVQQCLGTINQIALCEVNQKRYCVRIRVNEAIFQYEKGLIKEAVIARALERCKQEDPPHEVLVSDIIHHVANDQDNDTSINFDIGPDVHYYSELEEIVRGRKFPMSIIDWIDGQHLGNDCARNAYVGLGNAIKGLQSIRFAAYYRNFRELGKYRFSRDFCEDVMRELRDRNSDLALIGSIQFSKILVVLEEALRSDAKSSRGFVFCHNDLHANNIFYRPDTGVSIIDWDNLCIHHELFDLVKVKYWGSIGENGRFSASDDNFKAFCEGFGRKVEEIEKSIVFKGLCMLWLFRIYSFEFKRESAGARIPMPFLPPKFYADEIRDLAKSIA
ncbi:aminoglycoside phosphotransferase family protein [Henriciella sp. AS95]|uniref:aminoglycoside phosphotransferase family protein n=1 Tax=Henriciella sp. AS95 TaxID=3135782 RepID=UPI0031814100